MRIALLAVVAAALVAGATPAAGDPPYDVSSLFVVRVDPRLCLAPACGGYWVSLANRARTQCVDLSSSPRCYVARAVDQERQELSASIPDGAVVRGHLEPWAYEGSGELGAIIVADIRAPVGAFATGTYFRVRDRGIRCVRAPCFSYTAAVLNRTRRVTISALDLLRARASPKELEQAHTALTTSGGLFVLGRVTATSDGGRALHASRFYLRAPKLRG